MTNGSNDIVQKFKSLGLGSQIILAAAIVLLIASFLPWYSVSFEFLGEKISADASGWDAPGALWSIFATLIGLAMAGLIVARMFMASGTIPDNVGGFTWPKIYLGASGVAAVFLLIKLINHSGDIAFGFFLGIICVAAMCAGSFLLFQDEQKGTAA